MCVQLRGTESESVVLEESLVLLHLLVRQGMRAAANRCKEKRCQVRSSCLVECGGVALNESEALHDHYAQFEAEFSGPPRAESERLRGIVRLGATEAATAEDAGESGECSGDRVRGPDGDRPGIYATFISAFPC